MANETKVILDQWDCFLIADIGVLIGIGIGVLGSFLYYYYRM